MFYIEVMHNNVCKKCSQNMLYYLVERTVKELTDIMPLIEKQKKVGFLWLKTT